MPADGTTPPINLNTAASACSVLRAARA